MVDVANEQWTYERMLEALERGEHLPVGRKDPEWEHNALILDDLLHEGFVRGPGQDLHDGAGAYFSTRGIRVTDAGRRRLRESQGGRGESQATSRLVGFEARVLTVLIASPGDTVEARDVVEQAILSWNRDRSHGERVVLLPVRWETDAVPEMGSDAQSIVNRQLADRADIVVALFHSRVGAPTPRAESGTAEEIDRAVERGVPVHVYFAEMPYPYGVDPDELKRLTSFREAMQARGLLGRYASPEDLSAKVRTALEHDVGLLVEAPATGGKDEESGRVPRAVLRARFEARRPASDGLIIENVGDGSAENVEVELEPIGEGEAPELVGHSPIEALLPRTGYTVPIAVSMGSAAQWRVRMRWQEAGATFEETQSVSSF
ncbi:MAG: hypothetical protein QOG01_351 [Pseudonocardiales bacterium]|jgi:hypothetical protein|nr:hypothetical protein [Pseudonocardiales bacterium]